MHKFVRRVGTKKTQRAACCMENTWRRGKKVGNFQVGSSRKESAPLICSHYVCPRRLQLLRMIRMTEFASKLVLFEY